MILYYIILYYVVLYYIILHYIILYCIILYYIILYYIIGAPPPPNRQIPPDPSAAEVGHKILHTSYMIYMLYGSII